MLDFEKIRLLGWRRGIIGYAFRLGGAPVAFLNDFPRHLLELLDEKPPGKQPGPGFDGFRPSKRCLGCFERKVFL
jgi:hypothetical protein